MEKAYLVTQNTNIEKIIKSWNIDILYFWEWECEFNFLSFLRNKELIDVLFQSDINLTLLSPHLSNISLKVFNKFIQTYFQEISEKVQEFIVNDFWVLSILHEFFWGTKKIIFGNYLFNQQKDPLLLFSDRPNKDILGIDYGMYNDFFRKYNIKNIEIYNPIHWLTINNLNANTYVYYPYVIQNITRYCNRSLIFDKIDYSKIVDKCSWCKWKEDIKFEQDLLWKKIYSIWNKTIYTNFSLSYMNDEKLKRIIYNYDIIK